jgi:hypothetical protein
MSRRPKKPTKGKKQDPHGKARAAKRSSARRKAIAKKVPGKRWEGEWWIKEDHSQ